VVKVLNNKSSKTEHIRANRIEKIFITHLHGDHCFGLFGLLATLSLTGSSDIVVTVIGPVGLRNLIETNIQLSATYLTYTLEIKELEIGKETCVGVFDDIQVNAFPIKHKVDCFGYVMKESDKVGLDGKKAAQLGAKGPQMKLLKEGKDVTLANGNVIKATDVLLPPVIGKKVVILGDTSDGSSVLNLGRECDLLVHEATYDATLEEKAIEGGHSTSKMAGRFAKEIKCKKNSY